MRHVRFGTNLTVFLLFFGIAMLDAFHTHDWMRAAFWCVIGIAFLRADALEPRA